MKQRDHTLPNAFSRMMGLMLLLTLIGSTAQAQSVYVDSPNLFYWPLDQPQLTIGAESVTDFFGMSADLSYEVASVSYVDGTLAPGAFLDDGSTITFENDDDAGTLSWSVTRTGTAGNTGNGIAATVDFSVPDLATPTTIDFALSDVTAVDPAGANISVVTLVPWTITIGGVWPGDTDSNCTVEAADILPVGARFSNTGPARGGFDLSWGAKAFSPWGGASTAPEFGDSFVDTDGDGEIDEGDVLAIGVNFGETHAESTGCDDGVPKGNSAVSLALGPQPVGATIEVAVDLSDSLADLLGTAFKVAVDPTVLAIETVSAGTLIDNGDLLEIVRLDANTGFADAAFTRKGTDQAVAGSGTLALIRMTVLDEQATELTLNDVKLSTVAGGIFQAPEAVALSAAVATDAEDEIALPGDFLLHGAYPNPFNPETTIAFDLPQTAEVRLRVFDMLGREMHEMTLGTVAAGANRAIRFAAGDLASGTYLYRLEAQMGETSLVQTGRFILLK